MLVAFAQGRNITQTDLHGFFFNLGEISAKLDNILFFVCSAYEEVSFAY